MTNREPFFEEIEHTADWSLRIWAPDFASLLNQSVRGMYALSGTTIDDTGGGFRVLRVEGIDRESLLVGFLSEVLFLAEDEGLAMRTARIQLHSDGLTARMELGPIGSQEKEIKAVTFHDLAILERENGLQVTLVFDV